MSDNDKVAVQEETSVDESTESVEETGTSEESETGEVDDASEQSGKNKSNFKAMSKALKAARKELAELKARSGESDDNGDENEAQSEFDKSDIALFLVENPDAKELKAEVLKAAKKFNGISLEEAWKYVKATAPKESQTKKSVDVRPTAANPGKDLTKLSPEEALKLSNSQYLKWARANGK